MMIVHLNDLRCARGLEPVRGRAQLERADSSEIREWRCFKARLTQRDAARLARVTLREWCAAEVGGVVECDALARIVWTVRRDRRGGNKR